MASPGWYNENQFRDYPFLTRTEPITFTAEDVTSSSSVAHAHLPTRAIVDAGFVMEIDAGFDEAAGHFVYLHAISRDADTLIFDFRTTSPASNQQILFSREITATEFAVTWADSSSLEAEEVDDTSCHLRSKWRGFLVTGDLTELISDLASGDTLSFATGLWTVEPARIQSLLAAYLRAVNLGNFPRTLALQALECPSSSSSSSSSSDSSSSSTPAAEEPVVEPVMRAYCLAGDIWWQEGFNCFIRQDTTENAIIIGAAVGSGAGEPCDEVALFDGELPPPDSPHLSGGPGCHEIVKSINGVVGADIVIAAGSGFRVQADPEQPHRLIVNRDLAGFTVCPPEPSSSGGAT